MSTLSEKERAKIPTEGVRSAREGTLREAKKETGNYPMPDKGHAVSAKSRAKQQRKKGNLTKDEFDRINRKADKIIDDDD